MKLSAFDDNSEYYVMYHIKRRLMFIAFFLKKKGKNKDSILKQHCIAPEKDENLLKLIGKWKRWRNIWESVLSNDIFYKVADDLLQRIYNRSVWMNKVEN